MPDAQLTKADVISALREALPRRTFGGWIMDNAGSLVAIVVLGVSAFAFNDRLSHLEGRVDGLVKDVDQDFRTLNDKISGLAVQLAHDEGHKP